MKKQKKQKKQKNVTLKEQILGALVICDIKLNLFKKMTVCEQTGTFLLHWESVRKSKKVKESLEIYR